MPPDHEEALGEVLRREISRSLRRYAELQSRLIGYEIAITALIGPWIAVAHCRLRQRKRRLMRRPRRSAPRLVHPSQSQCSDNCQSDYSFGKWPRQTGNLKQN